MSTRANFTDLVLLNCLSSAARTTVALLGGDALPVRDASPPNARGRVSVALLLAALILVHAGTTAATTPDTLLVGSAVPGGGVGWVEIPNANALNPAGGITIEAWILPTQITTLHTIYGKNLAAGVWFGLNGVGQLLFYPNGASNPETGTASVPVGAWTHVAVTYDASVVRFYINGNLDATRVGAGPGFGITSVDLGIGAEASGLFPFNGAIAEVRLWRRPLDQDEIRVDLIRQIDEPDPSLVAVWPLEGSGLEALGNHPGSAQGNAVFAGGAAPPLPHDPAGIPLYSSPFPSLDGECETLAYSPALEVPIWLDDEPWVQPSPVYAKVRATGSYLYVCLPPMAIAPAGWVNVDIDTLDDGGGSPRSDDYRFQITQSGNASAFVGGFGWIPTTVSGFSAFAGLIGEFDWGAELRIPKSILPAPPDDAIFGLHITLRHEHVAFGPVFNHDWPPIDGIDSPSQWEPVTVDPNIAVPPDAQAPQVGDAVLQPERPRDGEALSVTVQATDDVDIASVTLFVDYNPFALVPSAICLFPAADERSVSCAFPPQTFPLGLHRYRIRATDHRGREGWGRLESFRVIVDGEPPQLDVDVSDQSPPLGGSVTLTAQATDAAGITRITVGSYIGFPSICDFDGTSTTETCTAILSPTPGTRIQRYHATATDAEGFFTRVGPHRLLFGNTGTDSDGDGLVDEIEALLCTSSLRADTDRDGLKDRWEVLGLGFSDGDFIDLPNLGADPCRKDVFLQYDYERGARVKASVLESIVPAFRDGGIRLHVEEHERPRLGGEVRSQLGATTARYQQDPNGSYWFDPKRHWTHSYAFSRHEKGRSAGIDGFLRFDIYVAWSNGQCVGGDNDGEECVSDDDCPPAGTCSDVCAWGQNKGEPCQDDTDCPGGSCSPPCACMLSNPDPATCAGGSSGCFREPASGQTYRMMHEIGHAIGLGHGGRLGTDELLEKGDYIYYDGSKDGQNWKPNYVSIMNYRYNGSPMCLNTDGGFVSKFDYSRLSFGTIDEQHLDERTSSALARGLAFLDCSFSSDPNAVPVVAYACQDPDETDTEWDVDRYYGMATDGAQTLMRAARGSDWTADNVPTHPAGIDLNCDGSIGSDVQMNVNGGGIEWNDFFLPGEPCDGVDNDDDKDPDGDDDVDEGCGSDDEQLESPFDWWRLPSRPSCIRSYRGDCYDHPDAYGDAILAGAADCRPSGAPDQVCTDITPVFPPDPNAAGLPDDWTEIAGLPRGAPRGLEYCDLVDNDGDGEVDEGCRDSDGDGFPDVIDNCPETANPDQADINGNYLGDVCETPAPPTALFLVSSTPAGATVGWSGGATADVGGYNLYRRKAGDLDRSWVGGETYPTAPAGATSYLDPVPGQQPGAYDYCITALNRAGDEGDAFCQSVVTNVDGDDKTDDIDNCPTVPNGSKEASIPGVGNQTNFDGDALGDACDNCVLVANEPIGTPPPGRTTTGGQLDDDADGYGNRCDGDFSQSGTTVGGIDTPFYTNAIGKNVSDTDCLPASSPACDKYDISGTGTTIGGVDTPFYTNQLLGSVKDDPNKGIWVKCRSAVA
jgi:hypothetical protein